MSSGPEPTLPLHAQAPTAQPAAVPPAGQPTQHPAAQHPAHLPIGPFPPVQGPPMMMAPTLGRPYAPPRRLAWPGILALVLVVLLLGLTAWQTVRVVQLDGALADTKQQLAQAQREDGGRFGSADKRIAALEKELGGAFNAERLAAVILPSVFRVRAGDFTGTAFAVGENTAAGGSNFFTNFHVIEQVWEGGGREVFLERDGRRFTATIVGADKANDVAQLQTVEKFTGLKVATAPAKAGQQIIVVGAPLGITDTVTTGVVSALRPAEGDSGPVVQFDAAINPGNSGGPVVNAKQQVVGIATAKIRDAEGIGLAIPIDIACGKFRIC